MVVREEEELAGGSRVCRCSGVARMVALRRRRTRWCATRCRDDGGWMRGAVADLLQRRGGAARRCVCCRIVVVAELDGDGGGVVDARVRCCHGEDGA